MKNQEQQPQQNQNQLDPNQLLTIPAKVAVGVLDILGEVVRDNMEVSFKQYRKYFDKEGVEVKNPTIEQLKDLVINIDEQNTFNSMPSYSYNPLGIEAEKLAQELTSIIKSQINSLSEEEE